MYFQNKTIENHAVEIDRFPNAVNLPINHRCQMVFVSASEKDHFRQVIGSLQNSDVLLVGDAVSFASSGGMIEFLIEDSRVRFAINPDAVTRSQLKVSSKLLALATIVHDEPNNAKN